jgi:hypothetical protein
VRLLLALLVACMLSLTACGVSSQDEPQLIKESTQPIPTATPSFDTETSPPPGDRSETTSSTTTTTTPTVPPG